MKKLLSLLTAVTLTVGGASNVISCGSKSPKISQADKNAAQKLQDAVKLFYKIYKKGTTMSSTNPIFITELMKNKSSSAYNAPQSPKFGENTNDALKTIIKNRILGKMASKPSTIQETKDFISLSEWNKISFKWNGELTGETNKSTGIDLIFNETGSTKTLTIKNFLYVNASLKYKTINDRYTEMSKIKVKNFTMKATDFTHKHANIDVYKKWINENKTPAKGYTSVIFQGGYWSYEDSNYNTSKILLFSSTSNDQQTLKNKGNHIIWGELETIYFFQLYVTVI